MNRRELLRFFSIGATITPLLSGAPVVEAAATLLAIPEVKPVVLANNFPAGHSPEHYLERLRWNPYESIWLKFWQIENNPPSCINYGVGPLEHCLKREPLAEEKAAVAAIIQWFGSNCGHSFIEEVLNACGYRVTFDSNLPNTAAIQKLQHYNVFGRADHAQEVIVNRRGRRLTLKPAEYPEVG